MIPEKKIQLKELVMKIEISREEMIGVLLARISEMDPEEARDELWGYYSENIFPGMTDEQLGAEFYDKIIALDYGDEDEAIEDEEHPPH